MAVGPINIYEYEPLAKERLSKSKYDFIAGGATDEITLQRTRRILDSIVFRPKVMEDVSSIDTSTTVLGHKISFPVMPAPSGAHARAHPDAELATGWASSTIIRSFSSYRLHIYDIQSSGMYDSSERLPAVCAIRMTTPFRCCGAT